MRLRLKHDASITLSQKSALRALPTFTQLLKDTAASSHATRSTKVCHLMMPCLHNSLKPLENASPPASVHTLFFFFFAKEIQSSLSQQAVSNISCIYSGSGEITRAVSGEKAALEFFYVILLGLGYALESLLTLKHGDLSQVPGSSNPLHYPNYNRPLMVLVYCECPGTESGTCEYIIFIA